MSAMIFFFLVFDLRQSTALMNGRDALKKFHLHVSQPHPLRRMTSSGDFLSEGFFLGTSLVPTIW